MSRVGKLPVPVPDGVEVEIDGPTVIVRGPRGELTLTVPDGIGVSRHEDGDLRVTPEGDTRAHRSRWGLTRTLVKNMITGVTEGFERRLELVGIGYRASSRGRDIELQLGFSHPVTIEAPDGIEFEVPEVNRIIVRGADKVLVGQVAANIRGVRPPEPYKGKGIRYEGERVRRKAGKAAAR